MTNSIEQIVASFVNDTNVAADWGSIAQELKSRFGGEEAGYEEFEWEVSGFPISTITRFENGNAWYTSPSGDFMDVKNVGVITVSEILKAKRALKSEVRTCNCGSGEPWDTCAGYDGDWSYCG